MSTSHSDRKTNKGTTTMQSNEETRLSQQAPEEASAAQVEPAPKRRGRPPGSKNSKKSASKKKSGKKKISKKLTSEPGSKKATRKKASKKKASKKKRAKKKTAGVTAPSEGLSRLMAAVEELRDAVVDLTQSKAEDHHHAVIELRTAAKARIAELEDLTVRTLKRFGL
ncbi:MAG: hypothetical protein V2J42_11520 [Wenzhouxiangella sp.]|jgi:hypothetical protein|nr:hypothetical protein [Wenzhouxiangella sp.]